MFESLCLNTNTKNTNKSEMTLDHKKQIQFKYIFPIIMLCCLGQWVSKCYLRIVWVPFTTCKIAATKNIATR
jgi:hypothetical protein